MRRLLWVAGWFGVAVWSLFALATYGLVDVIGSAAMRNADVFSTDPETVEWIFRGFSWVRGASVSVILVVWGVVSLAILSVPWFVSRLVVSAPAGPHRGGPESAGPQPSIRQRSAWRPSRDGVIDLGPGEYTVGDPKPGPPGAAPRIGPRP